MRFLAVAMLPVALAGCAGNLRDSGSSERAQQRLAEALAGRTAGEPVDCVANHQLDNPQIIDNRTLLYRESGQRIWRNDLPDACPSLRPDSIIIVKLYGSNLCRNDMIQPVERGARIPGAMCRLGRFTPYERN